MKASELTFWECCARLTDFEICCRAAAAVDALPAAKREWTHLITNELLTFQGFAEKEGLRDCVASYFFERLSLDFIAEGFDCIGLSSRAKVIWHLIEIFDEARLADANHAGDMSLFQKSEDFVQFASSKVDWDQYENLIFEQPAEFVKTLARFVRSHLAEFEHLDFDLSLPDRDPPNVGYLSSLLYWLRHFASENDETLPTLQELAQRCQHEGIKQTTAATHTLLVTGKFPTDLKTPLIRYHRHGARFAYEINAGERIAAVPNNDQITLFHPVPSLAGRMPTHPTHFMTTPPHRTLGQRLCGFMALLCWLAAVPALLFTGLSFFDSGPHGSMVYAPYFLGLFSLALIGNGFLFFRNSQGASD
ncbi:MAG: hypothetical protein V4672_14780 [Verrucomicrobiota bacterium]